MLKHNNCVYNDGDIVLFKITNTEVIGHLHINGSTYYICHDNQNFNGDKSPNMFGHSFSWAFNSRNSGFTDDVEILQKAGEVKDNYSACEKLETFFSFIKLNIALVTFMNKDVLNQYNEISMSDKKGMVLMKNKNTNKFVEIKFGRLLKTLSNESDRFVISDKEIESHYNSYLLYQNGNYLKVIKDIKGDDILKFYKRESQNIKSGSKIYNSCMNDKPEEFFELYTKNPKSVNMIAVDVLGKVYGRALVWTTNTGEKLMDKRYTSEDWVDKIFDNIRAENGYLNFDDYESDIIVDLEFVEFEKYPYLDTFRFLDVSNKRVYNKGKSGCRVLGRTDGSWYDY